MKFLLLYKGRSRETALRLLGISYIS